MSVSVFASGAVAPHASYPAGQPAQAILAAENGVALQAIGGSASAPPMRFVGSAVVPAGSYHVIPVAVAAAAAAAPAAGARALKRKSLPAPASGSKWDKDVLEKLEISTREATLEELLTAGGAFPLPPGFAQSADAQAVVEACGPITADAVRSSLGAHPVLPRVGHKLYKYLRLISGPIGVKAGLESVVDDLVIHLLDALGFNDGPLAVLSKNRLRLHMNQDKVACAIADVTVYDVDSNFRLAVTEHKREPAGSVNAEVQQDLGSVEAQLIAEALAAAQHNRKIAESTLKRGRSSSEGGAVAARKVRPGVLFMLRVLGDYFSFYSVSFDDKLVQIVEDYSKRDELAPNELPPTLVWKLTLGAAGQAGEAGGAAAAAAPSPPRQSSDFQFAVAEERAIIVDVLDRIKHVLLHS